MRPLRRLIIIVAEWMQVISLLAWTIGAAWAGGHLANMAIDQGYIAKAWPTEIVLNTGIVIGAVLGFAISSTAAAIVFSFAQIELNTRDIARYYVERRKTEAAIERAMK
jgi:hypothetical protein